MELLVRSILGVVSRVLWCAQESAQIKSKAEVKDAVLHDSLYAGLVFVAGHLLSTTYGDELSTVLQAAKHLQVFDA